MNFSGYPRLSVRLGMRQSRITADQWWKRDLLFDDDLIHIKDLLEDAEASPDLANTEISAELRVVFLKAAPIYRKHWWERHNKENREWIAQVEPLVQRCGSILSTKIAASMMSRGRSTPSGLMQWLMRIGRAHTQQRSQHVPPSRLQIQRIRTQPLWKLCFMRHPTA